MKLEYLVNIAIIGVSALTVGYVAWSEYRLYHSGETKLAVPDFVSKRHGDKQDKTPHTSKSYLDKLREKGL